MEIQTTSLFHVNFCSSFQIEDYRDYEQLLSSPPTQRGKLCRNNSTYVSFHAHPLTTHITLCERFLNVHRYLLALQGAIQAEQN